VGDLIEHNEADQQYVTAIVDDQLFGIPILRAQAILAPCYIASVPLAPDYVAGMMNRRGRIVTAIDLRRRLNFEPADRTNPPTLDRSRGRLSRGICRLDGELMVILNVDQVLDHGQEARPA
jgi:purine-binding chemotaxis protein CheW